MKNLVTIIIIGLSCITLMSAQLTLVDGQDFNIQGTTLESSISSSIYMAVGDADIGEFFWAIERDDNMSSDWEFSVCDLVTCYQFGVESCPLDKPNVIGMQDTVFFSVYLNNKQIEGTSGLNLKLWPKGDPDNPLLEVPLSFDVAFASSTIDTEIVTGINISPNPVIDILSVDVVVSEGSDVQLEVINAMGQVVVNRSVNLNQGANTLTFDAADYSNGVYSIITRSDAGITTTKFFVAK